MAEQENSASEFDRLSADAMEILLDEAQDEGMFEEALRLNSGNPGILRLLCGHPASPPRVRDEAAFGSTLRLTSSRIPNVPKAPTMSREASNPATFFITLPPKFRISPLPLIILQPSTWSLTDPA